MRSIPFTVLLTLDQHTQIDDIAAENRQSNGSVVRAAVEALVAKHTSSTTKPRRVSRKPADAAAS